MDHSLVTTFLRTDDFPWKWRRHERGDQPRPFRSNFYAKGGGGGREGNAGGGGIESVLGSSSSFPGYFLLLRSLPPSDFYCPPLPFRSPTWVDRRPSAPALSTEEETRGGRGALTGTFDRDLGVCSPEICTHLYVFWRSTVVSAKRGQHIWHKTIPPKERSSSTTAYDIDRHILYYR